MRTIRAVFDQADLGLAALDGDLRIVLANPKFGEFAQTAPSALVGKELDEALPGAGACRNGGMIGKRGSARGRDAVILRRGPSETGEGAGAAALRCVLRPVVDDASPVVAMLTVEDVTRQDNLERELRKQRDDYQRLADSMPHIVLALDNKQQVLLSNRVWRDYVGDDRAGALQGLADITHPSDADTVLALLEPTGRTASGGRSVCEARLQDHNGTYNWHLLDAVHIVAADGSRGGYWHVTGTNIEHQKRVERKLRQRTEVLLAEDRRKDEFLAVLGHEIRNPIAAMASAIQMLESDFDNPQWALGVLRSQIGQVSQLVEDLLDDARIRQGKISLKLRPTEIRSLIRELVDAVRVTAEQEGVTVSMTAPGDDLFAAVDPSRFEQVVSNLVSNAVQSCEPGGSVEVQVAADASNLVVLVRDNGCGIPAEMLDSIFEPFVQVANGTGGSPDGLGVGLSLVRKLVHLHGGTIGVDSDGKGHGATFTIRLPGAIVPESSPRLRDAPTGRHPTISLADRSVLIVDDNEPAAIGLQRLLESVGCEAEVAFSGKQAWALFGRTHFDVAVLDIGLPDISGHELARVLRLEAEARTQPLQLIALTGFGHERARNEARVAGFDHHLLKPANFVELVELIANGDKPAT